MQQQEPNVHDEVAGENNNIGEHIMNTTDVVRRILNDVRNTHREKLLENKGIRKVFVYLKNSSCHMQTNTDMN